MARRRFFVHGIHNGQAELNGDEARHLTQVLRVESGQVYEISDNASVYLAEVDLARKQQVVFRILEQLAPEPDGPRVTLLLSLIKFERLETVIEKATELGVTDIVFVKSERSEKGLEQAVPKRIQRWERIALEASQQSRRLRLPELRGPITFADALRSDARNRLFLDEERTGRPMLQAVDARESAAILVGPEGGWPDREREQALEAGWTPVSLGPLVLRTETAAISALAVLNAIFTRTL
jgi:16S rRNA (uracil1498-N3)-methyltransferase